MNEQLFERLVEAVELLASAAMVAAAAYEQQVLASLGRQGRQAEPGALANVEPEEPAAKHEEPAAKHEEPAAKHEEPATKPEEPAAQHESVPQMGYDAFRATLAKLTEQHGEAAVMAAYKEALLEFGVSNFNGASAESIYKAFEMINKKVKEVTR